VDVPDDTLDEHLVLVECHETTECGRSQLVAKQGVSRTVTFEDTMRNERFCCSLRADLFLGLAKSQRLRLREVVRHEQIMHLSALDMEWVLTPRKGNEVARDQLRSLVDQLVEGMLTVRTRFTPDHRACLVGKRFAGPTDMLSVALHIQLLQVRRKAAKI